MAVDNKIVFGGVDSSTYGIYISGEGVFNAPKRDVEMISIPGRNGSFALDRGRFENITVTYPAYTYETTMATFMKNLSDFRNALASKKGYQRLTDTFQTDEYRMATFKDGIDVKPIKFNTASEFEITFDCKPQRWLVSGETAITIGEWKNTETESGDIVEVENPDGLLGVKALSVSLEPIQDLNGYDKPWSGGSGKNKLQIVGTTTTINGITFTVNENGTITANGTATANVYFNVTATSGQSFSAGEYILSGCPQGGSASTYQIYDNGSTIDRGDGASFTLASDARVRILIKINNGQTVSNLVFKPMIRLASVTDATFAPWENICPISGRTEVKTIVSPTTSAEDGTTYTTPLGRTVYGGTLDVVSGELVVDRAMVDLGTLSWNRIEVSSSFYIFYSDYISGRKIAATATTMICDRYEQVVGTRANLTTNGTFAEYNGNNTRIAIRDDAYTDKDAFTTAMSGAQLVYELATPQTYQLTPQEVELLTGQNNVWSDSGDITLEYGQLPNLLINPTLFEASPLLELEGYGKINFNGFEVDLENAMLGPVTLFNAGQKPPLDTSVNIASSLYNIGDTITVLSGGTFSEVILRLYSNLSYSTYALGNINNIVGGQVARGQDQTLQKLLLEVFVNMPDMVITAGTSSSKTDTLTCQVEYYKPSAPGTIYTTNLTVTVTRTYDAATDTITWSYSATDTGSKFDPPTLVVCGCGDIVADSTISIIGNPTYIDCDIGEAYKFENDEFVSLNSHVDLGSKLPTLAPGANTITFDNTITDLKIAPRWWKV